MRKFIIAGLLAATLAPVAAQAQISPREREELRRDRQEVREERRDVQDARRNGTRDDVRDERRDVREARQELREDRRDAVRNNYGRDDWRAYRDRNRAIYNRGTFRSPYRYQQFRPGITIRSGYYAPRYYIADTNRYRLPRPNVNQRWVRHYDDVLLVNIRNGRVVDVIRNFYR